MLIELLIASGMVMLTVAIHATGLAVLGRMLVKEARGERRGLELPVLSVRALGTTVGLVLALFVLHGLEIWLYAFLYHWIGALQSLRTAVYFSTSTYGAIGFEGVGFAPRWGLIAAIEGLNGVILLGWSTAFFVTMVGRLER